jgi:hypothetical protein
VIYPDDAFGAAVLDGVTVALKTKNAEAIALGLYPRQTGERPGVRQPGRLGGRDGNGRRIEASRKRVDA